MIEPNPMLYIILAVLVVALIAIAPKLVHRMWIGYRFEKSLLSGEFDQSPVGQQFARWFSERPARAEQRQLFVQLSLGLGGPSGIVADRLLHCITEVMRGHGARFGDMLAQEMDRLIVFDPPTTAEQAQDQRIGLETVGELKARLRALDGRDG